MTLLDSEVLVERLSGVLLDQEIEGLDDDLVQYLAGLLSEGLEGEVTDDSIQELIGPFLESVTCPPDVIELAKQVVLDLAEGSSTTKSADDSAKKLKQGLVNMRLDSSMSDAADEEQKRFLWGTDSKVHEMTNKTIEAQQKSSAKDRRKARQELEKARREFQAKLEQQQQEDAAAGEVSAMVLPDYTSGRNERDVQIKNVSVSLDNGRLLLDNGELKFTHKRRYGLVGKVSYGPTTQLSYHHFCPFHLF
jgi:ATP-binding cassette subfamily F protein 3